jgi:hypothetical protein
MKDRQRKEKNQVIALNLPVGGQMIPIDLLWI